MSEVLISIFFDIQTKRYGLHVGNKDKGEIFMLENFKEVNPPICGGILSHEKAIYLKKLLNDFVPE